MDEITRRQAAKLAAEIVDAAKQVDNGTPSEADLDAAYDTLTRLMGELAELIPGERERSISSFFEEVGDGMVEAQKALDRQSFDYNASHPGGGLDNMYRIPKVSAEIKFGLSRKSGRGFNVLLFSNRDERSETQQNSVSFDIVSAPPPPEYLQEIPLTGTPLTRVEDRKHVKNVLTQWLVDRPQGRDRNSVLRAIEAFSTTLVFPGASTEWVVLTFLTNPDEAVWFDVFEFDQPSQTVKTFGNEALSRVSHARGRRALELLLRVAQSQRDAEDVLSRNDAGP